MAENVKQLYRSRSKRMIAGVCGGLGEYVNMDPTLIRLAFAVGTVFGFGSFLLVYVIMIFLVPEEPSENLPLPPAPPSDPV